MLYIANDVEAAGSRLGLHSNLSLGACPIIAKNLSFSECDKKGLIFYAELKTDAVQYEMASMRIGCSQLVCLEKIKKENSRYDPNSHDFKPKLVLEYMQDICEDPGSVMRRFGDWIEKLSCNGKVVGVLDTVFFDSGHLNLFFGKHGLGRSPFGWKGLDLASLYKGYTQRSGAKLEELGVVDMRTKPHRADQDAFFLARIGKVLLFDLMKW